MLSPPPQLDYTICVPSRKRVHNMPTIRALLPSALICVDEREVDDYRDAVPADKLLVHPPMDGAPRIINWMMDNVQSDIFIEIDDDFRGVRVVTEPSRFITDADDILAIIENAARNCKDLGLTTFCFARTSNIIITRADMRPIMPVQPICNAFGLMGAGRRRHYDTTMRVRADVDRTLRTLLEDRAVYCDVRFYFDCGDIFAGRGGNVGLVTPEQFEKASRTLIERWGKAVSFKAPNYQKTRQVPAIKIAVPRANKTAQK